MRLANQALLIVFMSLCFLACENNEKPVQLDTPAYYNFERNNTSTINFSGQTTRIQMATELINGMKNFDQTQISLVEMYKNTTLDGEDTNPFDSDELNESSKSIKSKVSASIDFFSSNTSESTLIKNEIESWIEFQVNQIFPNQNILAERGRAGQIVDGSSVRYVNEKGLEYNQAVNKGLIGALMVDQICNHYLSADVLDAGTNVEDNNNETLVEGKTYTNMEHKWDEAYGYLFGLSSDASDPLLTLGEDNFLNKYLSKVNADTDFNSIATTIFDAFKLGRLAIVENEYEIRDQQIKILQTNLSKVIGIRAVYYLQQGKLALQNEDMGGAFHDLSEGYGFIYSLLFTRNADSTQRIFTKNQVDGFLSQLMEGDGFWDVSSETLDQISNEIANEFDFTVEQAAN